MSLQPTGSQTVGPFFSIGLTSLENGNLATPGIAGEKVTIRGRVFDGDGKPVWDALIEFWQADAQGRYPHAQGTQGKSAGAGAGFKGFGRVATDQQGEFSFTTIKPGRVPGPGNTLQAPHIVAAIFARGVLKQFITRIYFPDDPGNAEDTVLNLVPPERQATLVAKRVRDSADILEWNIVLQGDGETVFFDW